MSGTPSLGTPNHQPVATANLRCVGCGHLLRSLRVTGRCPECGLEVTASLHGDPLAERPAQWLGPVRAGVALLAIVTPLAWEPLIWPFVAWACWLVTTQGPRVDNRPARLALSVWLLLAPLVLLRAWTILRRGTVSFWLETSDEWLIAGAGVTALIIAISVSSVLRAQGSRLIRRLRGLLLAIAGGGAVALVAGVAIRASGSRDFESVGILAAGIGAVCGIGALLLAWFATLFALLRINAAHAAAAANERIPRAWQTMEPGWSAVDRGRDAPTD